MIPPQSLLDRHCLSDDDDDDDDEEEDQKDNKEDDEEDDELHGLSLTDMDEDENRLTPGILGAGVAYTPTQILVEGWLHKKGTGQDWLGSRAWKARWGRLCWAKVQGHGPVEVPLLLMYWYPSSAKATTAICLDSTVVVAVDAPDPKAWNAYKFEIRHALGEYTGGTQPLTRTFCAAQRAERDAWVYAMAQALLDHAKLKQAVHGSSSRNHRSSDMTRRRPLELEPFLATVDSGARSTSPLPSRHSGGPRARSPPPPLPKSPRSVRRTTGMD